MSDLSDPLAFLRAQRDAAPNDAARAIYDGIIAKFEADQNRSHSQTLGDDAQTGAATADDVHGPVNAPLFTGEGSGNYIAGIINIFHGQATALPKAEYDAALKRYLTYLYDQYSTLDLRGIDERQIDPPLQRLYISLSLSQPQPKDMLAGVRGFLRKVAARARRDQEDAEAFEARTVDWTEAIRQHTRVAVIGAPGSGKTTLLHYTTVRLAEALARDDSAALATLGLESPFVPLLLPLREMSALLRSAAPRERIGTNPNLLLDCFKHLYAGHNLRLPDDFFVRLCEEGRALLLLDGLDEVATIEERELVSALIDAFVTRYASCRCVVTVRPAAWSGDARLSQRFAVCTVDPLSEEQQRSFLANWSRCVFRLTQPTAEDADIESEAEEFDSDLGEAIERNQAVGSLVSNPLLLTIVAIVFYNRRDLPENRAALYESCVAVLLRGGRGKLDAAGKQRENLSGLDNVKMPIDEKRELLAAIAFRMHSGGAGTKRVASQQLLDWAKEYLAHAYTPAEAAQRADLFIRELPVHLGLLEEVEQHEFEFSHQTFQEFLAARHIAEHEELWNEVQSHYDQTWWREVLLLCAGYLNPERCWRFLGTLVRQGRDVGARATALALAADALAEHENAEDQGRIRDQVQFQALRIATASPPEAVPAAVRVLAGQALGRVGDPRPGVTALPPPMVGFSASEFGMGMAHNEQLVRVQAFALAQYPVTNAQYARFVENNGYDPEQPWWDAAGSAWLGRTGKRHPAYWNHPRLGKGWSNRPVVGVSWHEATAFCRWLTQDRNANPDALIYRLPTEAEWEYAARGSERRDYPWGREEPDAEHANFARTYQSTTAVGCLPRGATPEGIHDLAGNVWEWMGSVYAPYPYDARDGRENTSNPANKRLTLRGGSWDDRPILLRASSRYFKAADDHNSDVGFRLARQLE